MLEIIVWSLLILMIIGLLLLMVDISPMILESYFDAIDILKERKEKKKMEKELLKDVF